MKQSSSFTGWDFTNTWVQIDGTTYPFLRVFAVTIRIGKDSFVVPLSIWGNWGYFTIPLNNNGCAANMENCHGTLSPEQSRKVDKVIGKIGIDIFFDRLIEDPYFGPILKKVLKNGRGPT